jgi:pectinesterase
VSGRSPVSKQLTMERDAQAIANYSNPAWVLGGWAPAMEPYVISQPTFAPAVAGGPTTLTVEVAAIPPATYQWFKDGAAIEGATGPTLRVGPLKSDMAGEYTVTATNPSGRVTSRAVTVMVR